ncbi:MAG: hypothetical protein JSW20_05440 [Nitrospiraceae bacterium]|jgi:hypothetical protein|nr:MAG: hypothetical protein JSW20_05440 [Nitrospiraceae bacterium]
MTKPRRSKSKNLIDTEIEQFCQGVTNVLSQIKHRSDLTEHKVRKKSKKKIA